ncbi:hypothetical protein CCACVL1_25494 [Corchorus capsularis]|uniref:Uncharacterized protein n=1 Tax=Corchorus capsularis TaxID=210143 RepID=A0A1R3GJN4_COCAP|nr:hypothetical protein CCACVL1_25494 [Corchorus capsularis]
MDRLTISPSLYSYFIRDPCYQQASI